MRVDSWRIAVDAAHDGLDAMRDTWPRRHRQLTGENLPRAGEACHAFEDAWLDLIGLAETVAAVTSQMHSQASALAMRLRRYALAPFGG